MNDEWKKINEQIKGANTVKNMISNFNMASYRLSELNKPMIDDSIMQELDELNRQREEEHQREEQYKQDVLRTLKNIEQNTGNIVEIVSLIRENNDKQDQIIAIVTEILTLGTAKTKKEAEAKFRDLLKRIHEFGGAVDSTKKLIGMLMAVYNSIDI